MALDRSLGLIAPGAESEEARPVPGRAGDGSRDNGKAGVDVLAPDIAARHHRDGVALAPIFAHQHGAGLEAPVRQLAAPRETAQDLGGLRTDPAKSLFLDVPADEPGHKVLGEALWWRRVERGPPQGCEGRRGRATGCGRSRPRSPRDRMIAGSCGSSGLASGLALARLGLAADAIDARVAGLLGYQRQAELLAHHAGEEAAHRVLLPAGRLHDGRDGRTLPALQHGDHRRLLRLRLPGFGEPARLAGPLAGGRGPARSRAGLALGPRPGLGGARLGTLAGADRGEAARGDAQRNRSLVFAAPPLRQGALRRDFLDEALAQQPAEHLAGRVALELGAKFDGAILALRGSRQQHQLGIGEFHRDSPFGWRRRLAPSPPKPRSGHEAGGAGSRSANAFDQARTVTLCSYWKASLFAIILWLVSGPPDYGIIRTLPRISARVIWCWRDLLAWK